MVSELHRTGFQRLRFMPYLRECLAYRVLIGPVSCFSVANGCHAKSEFPGATYSSASENEYFGWTDATSDDARKLAVKVHRPFSGHRRVWFRTRLGLRGLAA